jgi:predicted AAA+ superfamily ATPase
MVLSKLFHRKQLFYDLGNNSCFLWGARQVGKSTLLKQRFANSLRYDLLLSREFERLSRNPSLLQDEILASPKKHLPVIVDEVQKIPILLDEIHWLIENHGIQFILCGSSARKLKRGGGNLLGGRAIRYELFPLVYPEIPDFNLETALNNGLIPNHYTSSQPKRLIQAYVGDYLKEEIMAEALSRNIRAFSRFLQAAAFSNGEITVYQNIASDCGVSSPTVKEYFQILIDTLLGSYVPSFIKKSKRKVIKAPKFYFFDLGLVNFLLKRGRIVQGTEIFGKVFEHFIFQEINAYKHYSGIEYDISYWHTIAPQLEVDFLLGDHEVALEVKGTNEVQRKHLRGIKAFTQEYKTKRNIIVSNDLRARVVGDIHIYPWKIFLDKLWSGEII